MKNSEAFLSINFLQLLTKANIMFTGTGGSLGED